MRWRRRSKAHRVLRLALLALTAVAFAVLVSSQGPKTPDAEGGWFRRLARLFRSRKPQGDTLAAPNQGSTAARSAAAQTAQSGTAAHAQKQAPSPSDFRPGRMDAQPNEKMHVALRSRQGSADSTRIVWQSLALPHYRASKVQDVLEHWHTEALTHLLDSRHVQELLRNYMTALDWASKLFLPDMDGTIRGFTRSLISVVLDVDVCSKRLLYLSSIPIVTSRGCESSDIDFRKTKALHTLGVFYVLQGRMTQLSSLVRESSKVFRRELRRRHVLNAQTARVLMPFTRLSRYSLDALDYLKQYYRELHEAIMGSIVYPPLVMRTYSRLHISLQTVGQFFSTCIHARRVLEIVQRAVAELKGIPGGAPGVSALSWQSTGTGHSGLSDAVVLRP